MWDKAPAGFEGLNLAQIANLNPAALAQLVAPPSMAAHTASASAHAAYTAQAQQLRQARRIYVGGVPSSATDDQVRIFFEHAMVALGVTSTAQGASSQIVVAAQVNHEKMFGFVEFRSPDEATLALNLDGIVFEGQPLKISFLFLLLFYPFLFLFLFINLFFNSI